MKQQIRLPDDVRDEVFQVVYQKADEHKYVAKGRKENGLFMNQLVRDSLVGGRLAEYMAKGHLKTYIKDTILNRYAKERKRLPKDIGRIISSHYSCTIHEIEYVAKDHLSFHRTEDNQYLIVARINYLKLETAIRKLALYAAGRITAELPSLDLIVIIFEQGCPVNTADRELVTKGLELLGVKTFWWD